MRRFAWFAFFALLTSSASAENWPQWRGPNFNGSTDEENLPATFSRTENVAWTADLPGPSAATPVVGGDRVFLSSSDLENESVVAMCLDRKTGKVLWQHEFAKGLEQDTRSTYSSPSPATDGKLVAFFSGTGDLVVYDMDGKKKWSKNLGPFAFLWTFSTSPVLTDGKLVMQILQRDTPVRDRGNRGKNESYLLALDPETGETLWRQVRPSQAVSESLEAFSTPIPYEHNGRKELLVAGGDVLTGHDPETGEELWRWGTWNPTRIGHWRLVPSPVAGGGVVLVCAPKRDPVYAVKAGASGKLDMSYVVWNSDDERQVTSDVPTPAFYDGDFFVLADVARNSLSRVEPATGKVKWSTALPGRKFEASPTAADGKIYNINHDGDVVVVDAESGEILHNVSMSDDRGKYMIRSSVIASHGNLLIRTNDKLYCIGK